MKAGTDMPFERRAEPGKRKAMVLAILVHLLLAAFLFFGIRWQTKHEAVEVELWSDVPQGAYKPPPPPPEPKPEPKPEVKPDPKPAPKPDIVLKEEKKKPEPKKEEPKPEPKPEPKKEEKKPETPDWKKELEREEQQRKRDQTQAAMRDQANRELSLQQAAGKESAAASSRSKSLANYQDKIRAKVRGNLGFVSVSGNPTAKFLVTQLPSGEIISARMVRSSGVPAYDSAVERAIMKSSPLPLPDDKSAFHRELELTFCPQEGTSGCSP
jgi:colicin import membrane protein